MTLLWHDAAAEIWKACACRMAGEEAPPTPPSAPARQLLVVFLVLRNLVCSRRDLG